MQKRAVELSHGSLFTPPKKHSIIVPLIPEKDKVLFHTKTEGTEVEWNARSCYRLHEGVAIRPLQHSLTFLLLLLSDQPNADTANKNNVTVTAS